MLDRLVLGEASGESINPSHSHSSTPPRSKKTYEYREHYNRYLVKYTNTCSSVIKEKRSNKRNEFKNPNHINQPRTLPVSACKIRFMPRMQYPIRRADHARWIKYFPLARLSRCRRGEGRGQGSFLKGLLLR